MMTAVNLRSVNSQQENQAINESVLSPSHLESRLVCRGHRMSAGGHSSIGLRLQQLIGVEEILRTR
jgi:hypothetical protein